MRTSKFLFKFKSVSISIALVAIMAGCNTGNSDPDDDVSTESTPPSKELIPIELETEYKDKKSGEIGRITLWEGYKRVHVKNSTKAKVYIGDAFIRYMNDGHTWFHAKYDVDIHGPQFRATIILKDANKNPVAELAIDHALECAEGPRKYDCAYRIISDKPIRFYQTPVFEISHPKWCR